MNLEDLIGGVLVLIVIAVIGMLVINENKQNRGD